MSICEKLVGANADKQAYRACRKRAGELSGEYHVVFDEIQRYIWTFGSMDGSTEMICDLLTLFETGAAEKKPVLEITGDNVAEFCDSLIVEWKSRTWQSQQREKFNNKIHKKLANLQK